MDTWLHEPQEDFQGSGRDSRQTCTLRQRDVHERMEMMDFTMNSTWIAYLRKQELVNLDLVVQQCDACMSTLRENLSSWEIDDYVSEMAPTHVNGGHA